MDIIYTIISLISGAVGGNLAGSSLTQKNLGPIVNSIIGLLGGGLGDFLLKVLGILSSGDAVGATGSEFDISSILASIGAGGVSGGALTAIVTLIKDAIEKNKK